MQANIKQKVLSFGLTAVVLIPLYVFMVSASIPWYDFTKVYLETSETIWTTFTPKTLRPPQPKKPKEMKPQVASSETDVNEYVETEIQEYPVRVDLDRNLLKRLDLSPPDMELKSGEKPSRFASNPGIEKLALDDLPELNVGAFAADFGSPSPLMPAPGRRTGTSGRISLQAGKSKTALRVGEPYYDAPVSDIPVPKRTQKAKGVTEVKLIPKEKAKKKIDVSAIYKALAEWMRGHSSELPIVVKEFGGYMPGVLTSKVEFYAGQRYFELYLLCFESSYEVRIILVEGENVTFLIDQGFKKQSDFLRSGFVSRNAETNEITGFGTELKPVGDKQTDEFYQIFMSWWESVKHEVEK
jgi:hypothetical protein